MTRQVLLQVKNFLMAVFFSPPFPCVMTAEVCLCVYVFQEQLVALPLCFTMQPWTQQKVRANFVLCLVFFFPFSKQQFWVSEDTCRCQASVNFSPCPPQTGSLTHFLLQLSLTHLPKHVRGRALVSVPCAAVGWAAAVWANSARITYFFLFPQNY